MELTKLDNKVDGMDVLVAVTEPINKKEVLRGRLIEEPTSLIYYVFQDGVWNAGRFNQDARQVTIGSSDHADITISESGLEDEQITLKQVGSQWLINDSGKNKLAVINGIFKPQGVIHNGYATILDVGNSTFVIKTFKSDPNASQVISTTTFGHKTRVFRLRSNAGEQIMRFDRPVLFGSSGICDITFGDREFAGIISSYDNCLFSYSLSQNGDELSRELRQLSSESRFRIDNYEMCAKFKEEQHNFEWVEDWSQARMGLVELKSNGNLGKILPFPEDVIEFTIGRSDMNHLRVLEQKLSRTHAKFLAYDGRVILFDCDSTNGTFVNHRKISEAIIYPGDIVQFSHNQYILCYVKAIS